MNPTETHPLPNAADKAALKAIATTVIQTCPSLQGTAHEVASDLLKKYEIVGLDPDQVYFHRFDASQSSSKAFTGWEHVKATPTSSMTLTQLVIHRFRAADQDNADLLDVYAGFYSAGPNAGTFNETNEVRLHGNQVLKDFWSTDFSTLYTDKLTAFWKESGPDFRTLAKCNFLIQAVKARDKRQLSDEDFQFVTNAVIGPITWPVSLQLLQSQRPCADSVRTLDVDGYVTNNILRFVAPKGRQIVYMPGETDAFKVLETATNMHYWMLQRMNTEDARQVFMAHFSLADRQAIAENITDIMNRLVSTWGRYDHSLINQKNEAISSDAFTWMSESSKSAMFAEAYLSLTSNGDLRKKLWIGYLSAGVKVFGPMAVVGWPIALPVVGASIASMGLNIDQAVNGKTAEERKAGILGAVLSGIDLLFNLLVLKGPGSLEEVGPEVDVAEAQEMADLTDKTTPDDAIEKGLKPMGSPESTGEAEGAASLSEDIAPALPDTRRPIVPDHWQANELLEGGTPVSEAGKFQGIYRVNANPSTAIMMNDIAYYVRYEADINGGGHWAIIDPANPESFFNSIPVRLNTEGQWEIAPRGGLKGGGKPSVIAGNSRSPAAAAITPLPDSPYEVPRHLRQQLEEAASGFERYGLRDEYESPNDFSAFREFKALRKRLYQDAARFYQNPNLPTRPPVPTLAPTSTAGEIIDGVFEDARGLVIGESHDAIGSKQFLIDNMERLAQKNVKTLYMEHLLTDFHQAALDSLSETKVMSKELEKALSELDRGHITDPLGRYTFLNVVKTAAKFRIRVQAIDCMASYRVEGMELKSLQDQPVDKTVRQKMMNYFARSIIRADQALHGAHKWVALMGNSHSNTFEGIAGVSELEEGIGIRVEDVAESASGGIEVDPGQILPLGDSVEDRTALVRGDLRLQMETPWHAKTLAEFEKLLPRYGMYSLKRQPLSTLLLHRSRGNELVRTLIETDAGRYYIDRPNWPLVSGKRYDSIKELLQALNEMGLRLAGWSKPL
ncbi:membrane-targeted effector domain-containing toxin [Pseudomonas lini]